MGKPLGSQLMVKWMKYSKRTTSTEPHSAYGGTIEGNGARILMEKGVAIIDEMEEHVLGVPTRVAGTDGEIRHHVGTMHKHLLTSLDGYFSALQTK
jgi:hypothetical protein